MPSFNRPVRLLVFFLLLLTSCVTPNPAARVAPVGNLPGSETTRQDRTSDAKAPTGPEAKNPNAAGRPLLEDRPAASAPLPKRPTGPDRKNRSAKSNRIQRINTLKPKPTARRPVGPRYKNRGAKSGGR